MTGIKYDENKPPMALLDPEYLLGVSRVLGFGANKYSPNNWRGGIQYSRLISAALRHISAINSGEDFDLETGLSHAYHLGCCSMFLASMMNHRPDMDDRYKGNGNVVKPNVDNSRTMAVRNLWKDPLEYPREIKSLPQEDKYQALQESCSTSIHADNYLVLKCNAGSDGCNVGGTGTGISSNCTDYDPACWMSLQEAMEQFNAKTRMDNALHSS